MASVYIRRGSRFYWVKYRDGAGKIVRKSTGIDHRLPDASRKAKQLEAQHTQRELMVPARRNDHESWSVWSDAYLRQRYGHGGARGSLHTALNSLADLLAYFKEKEIRAPRQVTYAIAADFVPWRVSNKTLPRVSHNTARLRFVYFSILMGEAVRRGFADHNVCRDVRISRQPAKEKAEITAEHQKLIESELEKRQDWMREQWLVLMRQGCRVGETAVPLDRIDLKAGTITFRIKGGHLHTAALHPDLAPLVKKAIAEKRAHLIDGPDVGSWSPTWSQFFQKLKLPYSIHCTRVTVITRLVRAGHGVADVCAFIGHSEAVNRIYRKLKPPDSVKLLDTLAGAPTPR